MTAKFDSRLRVAAAFFILLLGYFYFRNSFYAPATVRLTGVSPVETEISLLFNTGYGFQNFARVPVKVSPNPAAGNVFHAEGILPQIRIKALALELPNPTPNVKITSAIVHSEGGDTNLPLRRSELTKRMVFKNLALPTARFHIGLFCLQVGVAFFSAWLVWLAAGLRERLCQPDWRSTLRYIFLDRTRRVFWIFFAISGLCFSSWLLAFWPGYMTNDSWMTVRELRSLKWTDWHPYIYTVYSLSLFQFLQSTAAISIAQIIASALLGSYILYYTWTKSVPAAVVIVFFVLFATSAPIAIYAITMWKDVPFSLALAFMSFFLYRLTVEREKRGAPVPIAAWSYPLLSIAIILLCQARHNGLLFYPLLPLLFWRRVTRQDYIRLCSLVLITFLTLNKLIPATFGIQKTGASPYHQLRTALVVMTHFNYYSTDRARDIKIVEEATGLPWEKIQSLFPRYWFKLWDQTKVQREQFLPHAGLTADFNSAFVTRLALDNLPAVVGMRTYEFLHSMGIDQTIYNATTDYYENPCQLWGTNLTPPGNFLYNAFQGAGTKWPWMRELLSGYTAFTTHYEGFFSRQVLFWNLLVYLAIFAIIIFCERGFSAITVYTLPSLLAAGSVYAVGAGESWRYFYYVYLTGIFAVPLYMAYLRETKAARQAADS